MEAVLLEIEPSDIFVLVAGAVTAFATVGGSVFALTKYILSGIRAIAREESASQQELLNEALILVKEMRDDMSNIDREVTMLKGWTAGFTAGTASRGMEIKNV